MYETSTALDPVAAFEFYLGKTHPDCKALFQTPNKATTKNMNYLQAPDTGTEMSLWEKILSTR